MGSKSADIMECGFQEVHVEGFTGLKLSGFKNTRARIQRVSDSRFFSGWCIGVRAQQIILQVEDLESVEPGETFIIELYGPNRSVLVQSVYMTINSDGTSTFQTTSEPFYLPGPAEPRFRVANFEAEISHHHRKSPGRVTDVSAKGLAVETGFFANRLDHLELVINLPSGQVHAKGHVRYCKPIPNSPVYRLGIRIEQMDRVGVARWTNFFTEMGDEAA